MESVKLALEQFGVNTSCRTTAVTSIRLLIEEKPEEKQISFVKAFALDLFAASVEFTDSIIARMTAQYVLDELAKTDYTYPIDKGPVLFADAASKAERFKNNPNNAWMFASAVTETSFKPESNAPVAPKQNKQTAAMELYTVHVANSKTPLTNSEFVHMLVSELGMTTSGARTYAYNCFKAGREAKHETA